MQLRKANEALRELQKKLCNRANAGKKRGKPPTVADAILDRLVHNAHKITLKGESMRKVINTV